MTSKTDSVWAIVLLTLFITIIFLAFYDYFSTPQFRILPWFLGIIIFMYSFFFSFGEYLGIFVSGLAKKNFHTRGGLSGVYEKHEEHHSGMVTYFFSTYTRYLRWCNYHEFEENSAVKRFFMFLAPVRIAKITDFADMFEDIPAHMSDTPEGTIFYHGTLRKAKVLSISQTISFRLKRALDLIKEMTTIVESAKAGAEASSAGQNRQMTEVATQLSTALSNFDKFRKEQPALIMQTGGKNE